MTKIIECARTWFRVGTGGGLGLVLAAATGVAQAPPPDTAHNQGQAQAQNQAQSRGTQVHIRVINAKTNQPIHDERLNVALKADQIGSVAMGTDKNGVILVETGDATTIRILANMYADCRPRGELYVNYSIATILKSGIVTGNLCSGNATAKPGELVLFEVPKNYIRTFPNPPATSLPHSDENPH